MSVQASIKAPCCVRVELEGAASMPLFLCPTAAPYIISLLYRTARSNSFNDARLNDALLIVQIILFSCCPFLFLSR